MALQFLETRIISQYIIDAWQNHLGTEMDPAGGQWYTNDPNNSGIGLFGGLTDSLASELIFDESSRIFTPHKLMAATAIVDNLNGLTPQSTVTLSYSYQDSVSSSHSTTNAIKVGVGVDIKRSVIEIVDVTVRLSFEYSYSWTDSTTRTETETKTFTQAVPMTVPAGKVYQAQLTCDRQELTIPYRAIISIAGQSETWLENPINGERNWKIDAGTLCSWINQFGSAGDDSYEYGSDSNDPSKGTIALQGTMTVSQTTNFLATIVDITSDFGGNQIRGVDPAILGEGASVHAPVVATIPLST